MAGFKDIGPMTHQSSQSSACTGKCIGLRRSFCGSSDGYFLIKLSGPLCSLIVASCVLLKIQIVRYEQQPLYVSLCLLYDRSD